jgi:hypothetical protein
MGYKLYISSPLDWWDISHFCSAPVVEWAQKNNKGDELMKWLIEYFDDEVPSLEEVDGALLTIKEYEYENILGKVG